jgi:hypothetical protein
MTGATKSIVRLLLLGVTITTPLTVVAQQPDATTRPYPTVQATPPPATAPVPPQMPPSTGISGDATSPIPAQMPPSTAVSGNRWTEDFESSTLRGWELLPGAGFAQGASGVMLAPQCPSHGLWAAVKVRDLLLEFDFLQGTGGAQVVLSLFELPAAPGGHYVVAIAQGVEIAVLREPPGQIQVTSGGAVQLSPGSWHRVSIQRAGGSFEVSVDGTSVLTAVDPQPHGPGVIGFGCHNGSGFGFDNISITSPELPPQMPPTIPAIPINIPGAVAPSSTGGTDSPTGPAPQSRDTEALPSIPTAPAGRPRRNRPGTRRGTALRTSRPGNPCPTRRRAPTGARPLQGKLGKARTG